MLNDLNILIGIEIELNIKVPHFHYLLTNLLPNYFILLQLYINYKLSFFRKNY